jgi:antitoxin VapB
MGEEYKAKIFKSGNSLALRLPKALGFEEGAEMRLREDHGKFIFEPVDAPPRKIDVSKFAGKAPWLEPRTYEEGEFEDSPREWHLLGRDSSGA